MNAPLVSVLIPVRNGEETIAETLASVFRQSHSRLQVVVVDNGSTDRTVEVVRDCFSNAPCECTLAHCPQPGANRARNAAYELAEGDFVQWLDADDQIHDEKIERQVAAFARNDDVDIAVGDWIWRVQLRGTDREGTTALIRRLSLAAAWGEHSWKKQGSFAERRFVQPRRHDFLLRLLEDKWSPPHSYLLRRTAAERLHDAQAWYPSARVCMDREYFSAAALLGMTFLSVPGAWSRYNFWSPGQISAQADVRARAVALHACFRRLRALAGLIGGVHEELLQQNRGLWRPLAAPLEALARTSPSNTERIVARVLVGSRGSGSLERWAKVITASVAPLWERHAEVLCILIRLADQGALSLEWDPAVHASLDS